jgi:nucleotide-binding universal stress UspA family protein
MYNKILVPLDGSELAECVLPHVETIARGCSVQNVVFLRVVEPLHWVVGPAYIPVGADDGTGFSQKDIDRIGIQNKATAKSYLEQLTGRVKYDGVVIQSEVITGQAAENITEYATQHEIDLIIIGTHGRSGISRWAYGSVADKVLRASCVPVLMIRAPGCVSGI